MCIALKQIEDALSAVAEAGTFFEMHGDYVLVQKDLINPLCKALVLIREIRETKEDDALDPFCSESFSEYKKRTRKRKKK